MTTEQMTWIDAFGSSHTFPDPNIAGVTGRGMPQVRNQLDPIAGGGSRLIRSEFLARRITVPFVIVGDEVTARTTIRQWAGWLNPLNGMGKLSVLTVLGDTRVIPAIYSGGLEGIEESSGYYEGTLVFDCPDPYWQDATPQTVTWTMVAGPFWSPVTAVTINNNGDAPVWPKITFTNAVANGLPGKSGVITIAGGNLGFTTNTWPAFNTPTSFTIDTDPTSRDAVSNLGDSGWQNMDFRACNQLVVGNNTGIVVNTGGAPMAVGSTCVVSWTRKWLHV